ncbi:MAG TPA: ATP-binding protein [Stenomitos sp.]
MRDWQTQQLFSGNSEMAQRMRACDWSKTSLGAVETWSQSLKTAVRIMLTSSQPMWVWWGKELLNLYNDSYIPILGGKHPAMFARPGSEVWHEIWDEVGPRVEYAMLNNEGTYDESTLLVMERNGYPEETYYTFSYSPIPDEQGNPAGIICANTDETQRIIGARQLALLQELAAKTADARTFDEACTLSAKCLETNLYDFPFAMIYLVDATQQLATLAGTSGIDPSHPAVPHTVHFDGEHIWPFAQVIQTQKLVLVSDLATRFGELPRGKWDRILKQAVVAHISPSGSMGRSGILVAGLNPLRLWDDHYQSFIELVSGQISASIANANAYEEERKRAEALAELDRAKTLFFTNISHEFRTPLTLILGPLEDLSASLAGRLEPEEQEQLELLQRNGLRLQKLVNALLDFARIEAGRMQALYKPTDLATYTSELASAFRSLVEQAGLRLIVDCPPLPEAAYVDQDMWEKIVLNLLSNAFKFTFSGSITVQQYWRETQIELSVIDTGVGIPAAEMSHLFDRFHRVEQSQGRSFEGSGIGLSLVQELVQLHGGSIHVTSTVGKGSCFTLSIPTGFSHLPREQVAVSNTPTSKRPDIAPYVVEAQRWLPNGGSAFSGFSPTVDLDSEIGSSHSEPSSAGVSPSLPRIVLADDNADMRDYIQRLLGAQYRVEAVADGMIALQVVQNNPPDLLISDIMMPIMDGFELLRQIRSNAKTLEVPVVLLSARAGEEARIEGLKAGADDYLIKPFSARELKARVEATLKLAQLRRMAREREQALEAETQMARTNLNQLMSSLRDGFVMINRRWRYTYVNRRLREILKLNCGSVVGQKIWDLFPEVVGTDIYDQLHHAMHEKVEVHFEFYYPKPDCWVEHRVYPTTDGIAILMADVSDRKQAQAALEARAAELYNLNSLLAQAATLMEERNQELDRFVHIVSHDLKAPLRAIANLSQWIEDDLAEAHMETIPQQMLLLRSRVHRMEAMISGLLDYSRIGRTQVPVEQVAVGQLLTEIIDSLAPPSNFEITIAPDMPTFRAKRLLLSQVFSNLIGNAILHHHRSEGRICISVHEQGDYYEFAVADDGPGIPPEQHSRIFMIFQALNQQKNTESSGIGLSIVKKIIDGEHGSIRLESCLGRGSTFFFTWPKKV